MQTLILKLSSNIVVCAGSGNPSVHCSLKFLNEPPAPITCAVCAQRLWSPKAIFFFLVSATVKLVHFSKVKHRLSAHPDQDRQGKWLKNLIKNSKLHHYHAYHRPLPGEQLIKHPKFMTSSPWDSTPPSPLMGFLLKGKAPGWKERTGCLLNGGYRAGRWGAEDGWESVWGSTEAEKTKDLGNKEEMWLGWGFK